MDDKKKHVGKCFLLS